MRPFDELTYRGQARRMRVVALQALARFPVTPRRVRLVQHGENTVFRVDATEGRFLLRVPRADYNTPEGIDVELTWLDLIARESHIVAPRPVRGRDGNWRQPVSHPTVPGTRHAVLFHWVYGAFRWRSLTPAHMLRVGALISELQRLGKAMPSSAAKVRPVWTASSLVGEGGIWGSFTNAPGVSAEQLTLFEAARSVVVELLTPLAEDPTRCGFIHADLHPWNFLIHEGQPRPIDFDDCGFGLHLYDVAVVQCATRSHPKREALWNALTKGFAETAPFDESDAALLPAARALRMLNILAWFAACKDNPRIAGGIPRWIKESEEVCRALLDGG